MFQELAPRVWNDEVFSMWDRRWALLTAGTKEHYNTMTVGWGGLGVLWRKPVVTLYVRPNRYTYTFMESNDTFTLSFFEEAYRKQLVLCGSASGREHDKFAECGFHADWADGTTPYVQEASLVLVCKKLYWNDLDTKNMDPTLLEHYESDKVHRMYVGEITKVLRRS